MVFPICSSSDNVTFLFVRNRAGPKLPSRFRMFVSLSVSPERTNNLLIISRFFQTHHILINMDIRSKEEEEEEPMARIGLTCL